MKVMLTAIIMAFLCINLNAQNIEGLFDEFAERENATRILFSKNILKLIGGDESNMTSLKDVKGIEIVVLDEGNNMDVSEYKKLLSKVKKFKLEELVQVRSKGSLVDFMFNEEGEFLKDLIMLARSDDGSFMLRLDGRILKKDIGKLDLEIEGMDHLKKLGRA